MATAAAIIQIKTFVFFDLETTGLDVKKERITEIAMIAVNRDDFLSSVRNNRALPRILQKLSIAVNPTIPIHPRAAEVSKLTSDLLTNQESFPSAYLSVAPFLSRLPKPVCLIAHNGVGYDFPLLKNELARYDLKINENLLILDTMIILKKVDASWRPDWFKPKPVIKKLIQNDNPDNNKNGMDPGNAQKEDLSEPMNEETLASMGLNDNQPPSEPFTAIYDYKINYGDRVESWRSPPKKVPTLVNGMGSPANSPGDGADGLSVNKVAVLSEAFCVTSIQATAIGDTAENGSGVIPALEQNETGLPPGIPVEESVDLTCIREKPANGTSQINDCLAKAIISQLPMRPSSYNQASIYRRLFNAEVDQKYAHTAEGDCLSLLEIAIAYGEDFVNAADRDAAKI